MDIVRLLLADSFYSPNNINRISRFVFKNKLHSIDHRVRCVRHCEVPTARESVTCLRLRFSDRAKNNTRQQRPCALLKTPFHLSGQTPGCTHSSVAGRHSNPEVFHSVDDVADVGEENALGQE